MCGTKLLILSVVVTLGVGAQLTVGRGLVATRTPPFPRLLWWGWGAEEGPLTGAVGPLLAEAPLFEDLELVTEAAGEALFS